MKKFKPDVTGYSYLIRRVIENIGREAKERNRKQNRECRRNAHSIMNAYCRNIPILKPYKPHAETQKQQKPQF